MINNLTGVLVRFRQHQVALICDTEKMFHQFQVKENDRNYLRFVWWKDGDMNSQPQAYRMTVHLFGAISSPGCANYGLKHLAKENSSAYPVGSQFVARDFYVDDGVTSAETVKDAIRLAKEARELCAKGGLRLHKFVTNNSEVLKSIPASEHATETRTKDLTFNETQTERALGIYWNVEKDCFTFNITLKDQPPSCPQSQQYTTPLASLLPMYSRERGFFKKCVVKEQTGTTRYLSILSHGGSAGEEIYKI